jgi:hypothetical protein
MVNEYQNVLHLYITPKLMKKIRIILTLLAFAVALAGATASAILPQEVPPFGKDSYNLCTAGELQEIGCGNGGTHQCTVYIEDLDEVALAYAKKTNASTCAKPLRRFP